jgi:hypothetical protein
VDFGVLTSLSSSDPTKWTVEKVWYSGALFNSLEELANKYASDPSIHKTKIPYVRTTTEMKSAQALRGNPVPTPPQRPPVQVRNYEMQSVVFGF